MEYLKAKIIAEEFISLIVPHCAKISIAGSLRRECSDVGDIDIVTIPYQTTSLERYFNVDNKKEWKNSFMKNGPKYKQLSFKGANICLFITNYDSWGLQFLIRTGSANFSKMVLSRWKQVSNGGYSENCLLHDNQGRPLSCPDEKDVFKLCLMNFVEPKKRNI